MFNALKYTQELEKAGFSRKQAETSVQLMIEIMDQNFATKSDLKDLEFNLRADFNTRFNGVDSRFQGLESRMGSFESRMTTIESMVTSIEDKISSIESKVTSIESKTDGQFAAINVRFEKVESKFSELEYRMTIKLGAMLSVAVGVIAVLVKL